jgi:hypothetical protein
MKNLKIYAATVICSSALCCAATHADPVSYNNRLNNVAYDYVGLQYITQDWNDCDQDGLNAYGSKGLSEKLFVVASFADVDGDACGSSSLSVGLGFHTPLNNNFDLYTSLSAVKVDWDGGDESGLAIAGGIRGFLTQQLESRVELRHTTTGDSETTIGGGLAYWFGGNWAATIDASTGSDTTSLLVGARLVF